MKKHTGGKNMAVSIGVVKPLSKSSSEQLLKDFERSELKPYTEEQKIATMRTCKEILSLRRSSR